MMYNGETYLQRMDSGEASILNLKGKAYNSYVRKVREHRIKREIRQGKLETLSNTRPEGA